MSLKGNFFEGRFQKPKEITGTWNLKSPADFDAPITTVEYSFAEVEAVVESAAKAFKTWKKTSLADRIGALKRYQAELKKREQDFILTLGKEIGKPAWEALSEINTMVNKIDVSIDQGLKLIEEISIGKTADQSSGSYRFRPHGVMVVVGPFNFPGHLPNGHFVPALLSGNTVIFKPSEKTPYTAQLIADCFEAAKFPAGVFNLIQGEKEVSRRLCVHENVDGVLFTGSYEVGVRIKQDTLSQHWKILALEMGGKNPSIIWKDADLDAAVRDSLVSAFITTGQRCSATSRILIHDSLHEKFVEKLHEKAKNFKIGHPSENPFMGPLIDEHSVDRFIKFQGIGAREGFELVMRGKQLETSHKGHYVTPSILSSKAITPDQLKKSVFLQSEIFAPCVAVTPIRELEEAIALANGTQYGLVCSVFSKDKSVYERALEDLRFGLVNWNRPTIGASAKLPFGGLKKSGNHFPTALFAVQACVYPVSSLEAENNSLESGSLEKQFPGINWDATSTKGK